jgi:hypothetical protein
MLRFVGFTAIETNAGTGTVIVVEPLIPAAVAVMVAVPSVTVAANPLSLASLLMLATLVKDELHKTEERTCVLPLLNVPVAVRSCCDPNGTDVDAGEINMLVRPLSLLVA